MCPRVSPALIRKAYNIDRCLPLLLPQCRSLEQATQELKWMKEELGGISGSNSSTDNNNNTNVGPTLTQLRRACKLRSRGVPLQYILGSQPFGSLEILCKRNVLIPRWETEEWSLQLTQQINSYFEQQLKGNSYKNLGGNSFRVLDLCTGTGCIALTILTETYLLLSSAGISLEVTAVDCSADAIQLARRNYIHNSLDQLRDGSTESEPNVGYKVLEMDALSAGFQDEIHGSIDVLTCNPPYIPKREFVKEVRSSVRFYEPTLALIGDLEFYKDLVDRWIVNGYINSFVYEVGSFEQIEYVRRRVAEDSRVCNLWSVGVRYDSSGKPRCVYGFKKTSNLSNSFNGKVDFTKLYAGFGQLL